MIQDAINSAVSDWWSRVVSFWTFSFLDPFWHWVALGIAIVLIVSVVCYFFSSWLTFLRPIGGFIILLVTFGLYAYRRGENEARAFDKPKKRK